MLLNKKPYLSLRSDVGCSGAGVLALDGKPPITMARPRQNLTDLLSTYALTYARAPLNTYSFLQSTILRVEIQDYPGYFGSSAIAQATPSSASLPGEGEPSGQSIMS